MRYLAPFAALLIVVTVFTTFSRFANSAGGGPHRPDVTVSLAIIERGRTYTTSSLHVIIENTSENPDPRAQNHFDETNSRGYDNLTLEWKDPQGRTGTVSKVARGWDSNSRTTTALNPGEALVREISFDPKIWQGWPTFTDSIALTLKVVYHSARDPEFSDVWSGTVTTKEQTVVILRP